MKQRLFFLGDIRFWIFLFFVIRLIGITNPPLEIAHNWRQTTVTMVARNFLETDNNILYPRVDFAGNKTGITGMEFPFLNYLIYLFSVIFGYQHWYGRLINLLISSIGIFYFFKLLKKYFEEKIAFLSTLILLSSIWFSYSRKIMPDTFSMSFVMAGIYYGMNYLDYNSLKKNYLNLLFYLLLTMLGTLSKLPAAYLLVIFLIPICSKHVLANRKIILLITSIVAIIPCVYWYFYWVPHLVEDYGFWHFFMGKSFFIGMNEIADSFSLTLQNFYEEALKYSGFIVFAWGTVQIIRKKNKILGYVFLLSFLSFLIIVLKAGNTFSHHSYYIIPFVPVMALIAGYGLSLINNHKIAIIILLAICIEGILNQQHDFRVHKKELALLNLENDLNKVSAKEDLILINSGQYPTPMYFAHRKGWIESNEQINNAEYIRTLKEEGLKYIVILKNTFGVAMPMKLPVVLETDDYCIYKLLH